MYQPKEMAEKLGISVSTLQRWDREKTFIAKRNPKGRCYYTENQYLKYIGQSNEHHRKVVAYTRVSNKSQADDLQNPIELSKQFYNAKGVIDVNTKRMQEGDD